MKTKQEIAEQIAIDADMYCEEFGWQRIDLEIACYEMARQIQRWIPVDEELPEQIKELLIGNNIKSENVLVKRKWDDTGEIAIEINCRFRPSQRIGFLWNIQYEGSSIIEWRPIEYK